MDTVESSDLSDWTSPRIEFTFFFSFPTFLFLIPSTLSFKFCVYVENEKKKEKVCG